VTEPSTTSRSTLLSPIVAALPVALGIMAGVVGPARQAPPLSATTRVVPTFDAGPVVATTTARGFLNVYFGNLHAHTSYSDGVEEPNAAFLHARDVAGLDFMALTEHNHQQAGRIAENHALYSGTDPRSLISIATRLTENGRFVALYGQEFSTISAGNHLNVLDVPDVIDVPNGAFGQLLNTWLPSHPDSLGGLAVLLLNHPAITGSSPDQEYGRDDFGSDAEWVRRVGAEAAMIAMINGPSHATGESLRPSAPAETEVFRYLNLGFHLAPTADQDNHKPTWGTITNARTAVIADDLSKGALLRAMKARHVYATEDKNLRIVCRVNGQLCGDRLSPVPAVGAELSIELTIHDDDEPAASYKIDVFSDQIGGDPPHDPVEVVSATGNTITPLHIEDVHYNGGSQYVFFRIRQLTEDGDEDRAWTAPVWIEAGATPVPPPEDTSRLVASRHSAIYHTDPNCAGAKAIKPANRIVGAEAKRDRTVHANCPL
jgi:hypothetical protein